MPAPTYAGGALQETEESLAARRVASPFATRMHVLVNGGVARITVGEAVQPGETNWHTSFTLTAFDAIQLANLIFRQDDADRRAMGLVDPQQTDLPLTKG